MISPSFKQDPFFHRRIGDYRLVDEFPRGGMSRVFVCEHVDNPDDKVAIKLLRPDMMGSMDAVKRFQREIRIMRQTQHPNIVTVIDELEDAGYLFIIMELIPGATIRKVLRERTYTLEEAAPIWMRVADALAFVHRQNIVHRDVASDNIKVRDDYGVKLMDFGVATMEGEEVVTQLGTRIGKVLYMAPEQVRGERLDEAADVHALGILAYEMLKGEFPFNREEQETRARGEKSLRKIRWSRLDKKRLPADVMRFIERATAYLPGERFRSCNEIISFLEAIPVATLKKFDGAKHKVDREEAKLLCEQGKKYFAGKQYHKAARVFQQSLRFNPNNPEASGRMLQAMAMSASFSRAVDTMQTEVASSTTEQELMESRLFIREIREQAKLNPREAVEQAANELAGEGMKLLKGGRGEAAYEHFHAALSLFPEQGDANSGITDVRTRIPDIDERIIQRKRTLRVQTADARARVHEGKLKEARTALTKAKEIDPGNDEVLELQDLVARLERRRTLKRVSVALAAAAAVLFVVLTLYTVYQFRAAQNQRRIDAYLEGIEQYVVQHDLVKARTEFDLLDRFVHDKKLRLEESRVAVLAKLRGDFEKAFALLIDEQKTILSTISGKLMSVSDVTAALAPLWANATQQVAAARSFLRPTTFEQGRAEVRRAKDAQARFQRDFDAEGIRLGRDIETLQARLKVTKEALHELGSAEHDTTLAAASIDLQTLPGTLRSLKLGSAESMFRKVKETLETVSRAANLKQRLARRMRDQLLQQMKQIDRDGLLRAYDESSDLVELSEQQLDTAKILYVGGKYDEAATGFEQAADSLAQARSAFDIFARNVRRVSGDAQKGKEWLVACQRFRDLVAKPARYDQLSTALNMLSGYAGKLGNKQVSDVGDAEQRLRSASEIARKLFNDINDYYANETETAAIQPKNVALQSQLKKAVDALEDVETPFTDCGAVVDKLVDAYRSYQKAKYKPTADARRGAVAGLRDKDALQRGVARFTPAKEDFAKSVSALSKADNFYTDGSYGPAAIEYERAARSFSKAAQLYAAFTNSVISVSGDAPYIARVDPLLAALKRKVAMIPVPADLAQRATRIQGIRGKFEAGDFTSCENLIAAHNDTWQQCEKALQVAEQNVVDDQHRRLLKQLASCGKANMPFQAFAARAPELTKEIPNMSVDAGKVVDSLFR